MPRPRAYWIRLEDGVHDHPKTVQLSLSLGIGREQTVGHLTRLWLWLLRYRQTGVLEGVSDELLAEASGWRGDPSEWRQQLRRSEFITRANRVGERAHGWMEANGRQLREVARKRETARKLRRTNSARLAHVSRTFSAPRYETIRDETKEEKHPPTPQGGRRGRRPAETRPPGFERWWSAYPAQRRVARKSCLGRWRRDGLEDRVEDLLHVLEVQKQSRDWTKDDGQYVPMTTTYLSQERYAVETDSDAPGLCVYCSEPAEPGHTHCSWCESQGRGAA